MGEGVGEDARTGGNEQMKIEDDMSQLVAMQIEQREKEGKNGRDKVEVGQS